MTYIDKRRISRLASKKRLFVLPEAQPRTHGTRLPNEEKTSRKRDQSLTLTVGVSETKIEDRGEDAVQLEPESSRQRLLEVVVVDGATVDTGMHAIKDSVLVPLRS